MAAKYRKISPCIWNDAKVRELSDKGKLALLFLLTHPHMTPLGVIRANCPGLGCELGWKAGAFKRAFAEILSVGIAHQDERATLIWFPNFLKYNLPESPNVVTSWVGAFGDLPECALRDAALRGAEMVVAGLSEPFQKAFREGFLEASGEAFAKGMPNQEQEQDKKNTECVFNAPTPVKATFVPKTEPESVPEAAPKPVPTPATRQPSVAFDQFFEAYPEAHRQGGQEAEREWVALEANRALPGLTRILDALGKWEDSESWKREGGRYIPSAANFIKREYWLREPTDSEAKQNVFLQREGPHLSAAERKAAKMAQDGEEAYLARMRAREMMQNGNTATYGLGIGGSVLTLPASMSGQARA